MHIHIKIGEPTTIIDPETGDPVTVTVTAAEDGQTTIQVVAAPDVPVGKVRDPEPPPRVIH